MSRSSFSAVYERLKRKAKVLSPDVEFGKTEQYKTYRSIVASGGRALKNKFYLFQFHGANKQRLTEAQNRWSQQSFGQTRGVNGRTVLENSSPAMRKIMRGNGRQFKSLKSFNNYINKANEFMDKVSEGKITKAQIKRGLERTIKEYSDPHNPNALNEAELADLNKELERIDMKSDEGAFEEIANYENKEDWYEPRKEALREISKIRKEVQRQFDKGKSINSKTAKRYKEALAEVAGVDVNGKPKVSDTWFGTGTTKQGKANKRGFSISKINDIESGRVKASDIFQNEDERAIEAGIKYLEENALGGK